MKMKNPGNWVKNHRGASVMAPWKVMPARTGEKKDPCKEIGPSRLTDRSKTCLLGGGRTRTGPGKDVPLEAIPTSQRVTVCDTGIIASWTTKRSTQRMRRTDGRGGANTIVASDKSHNSDQKNNAARHCERRHERPIRDDFGELSK